MIDRNKISVCLSVNHKMFRINDYNNLCIVFITHHTSAVSISYVGNPCRLERECPCIVMLAAKSL